MQNVTVFNTIGSNEQTINFSGANREDLELALRESNVLYEGMEMVIGDTQVTLGSSQSQVPQSDFTLFLMPKQVKSGSEDDEILDLVPLSIHNDFDEDEDDYKEELTPERVYSIGVQSAIDILERTQGELNVALQSLRNQYITDPRTLELAKQARAIQENLRRG